ncbi:MAG: ABC transporter ATP-binding protein [Planctomycetota bacterium]
MIDIQGLTKYYGQFEALVGLNLKIGKGVIFGYIGPNGAGKTTTIRILAGLLKPSSGNAYIDGFSVVREREKAKKKIGYMPDFFGVYEGMTLNEYLDFFAAAFRIKRAERRKIIDAVLELTDMTPLREDMVKNFSRGQRQRACLAKTLIHDPAVLLLDEPASGLDPRARIEFKELLLELKSMGKTILISSHILTELSAFCDEVGFIENGRLITSGPIKEILQTWKQESKYEIEVLGEVEKTETFLKEYSGVEQVQVKGQSLTCTMALTQEQIAKLLQEMVARFPVIAFQPTTINLEDVFLTVTKGTQRKSTAS